MNLLLAKQRNGPTGDVPWSSSSLTRFESAVRLIRRCAMIREKLCWISLLAMWRAFVVRSAQHHRNHCGCHRLGNVTERYVQTNIRLKSLAMCLEGRTNEDGGSDENRPFEDAGGYGTGGGRGNQTHFQVRAFPLVTDVNLFTPSTVAPEGPDWESALADLMDAEYLAIREGKLLKKLQMIEGSNSILPNAPMRK